MPQTPRQIIRIQTNKQTNSSPALLPSTIRVEAGQKLTSARLSSSESFVTASLPPRLLLSTVGSLPAIRGRHSVCIFVVVRNTNSMQKEREKQKLSMTSHSSGHHSITYSPTQHRDQTCIDGSSVPGFAQAWAKEDGKNDQPHDCWHGNEMIEA